jgi:hypothetical protein
MEVRGMPLTAFFAPEVRERVAQTLEAVVTRPQVADLQLASQGGIGRPRLTAAMFLAPLANASDGRPRILGCLQSDGGIGRTPRRFDVESVQCRRIVATATTEDEKAPSPTHRQTGFAEAPLAFDRLGAMADRPATRPRPHLRLVRDQD